MTDKLPLIESLSKLFISTPSNSIVPELGLFKALIRLNIIVLKYQKFVQSNQQSKLFDYDNSI